MIDDCTLAAARSNQAYRRRERHGLNPCFVVTIGPLPGADRRQSPVYVCMKEMCVNEFELANRQVAIQAPRQRRIEVGAHGKDVHCDLFRTESRHELFGTIAWSAQDKHRRIVSSSAQLGKERQ